MWSRAHTPLGVVLHGSTQAEQTDVLPCVWVEVEEPNLTKELGRRRLAQALGKPVAAATLTGVMGSFFCLAGVSESLGGPAPLCAQSQPTSSAQHVL